MEMKTITRLDKVGSSFNDLNGTTIDSTEIFVWSNIYELIRAGNHNCTMEGSLFNINIEMGKNEKGEDICVFGQISMFELERFAKSILTQIDIIRKNYLEEVKIQQKLFKTP